MSGLVGRGAIALLAVGLAFSVVNLVIMATGAVWCVSWVVNRLVG